MGARTKIDWCNATWNPVTGCLYGCGYCYARRIAERFGAREIYDPECQCQRHLVERGMLTGTGKPLELDYPWKQKNKDGSITNAAYPFGFAPTFHRYKLDEPQRWKKPRTIFVCSMADLFGEWVPDEWIKQVFEACEAAPQHRYLFLTKNPTRLCKMASAYKIRRWNEKHEGKPHPQTEAYAQTLSLPSHDNWWFGSTLDSKNAWRFQGDNHFNTFMSIEPLREFMDVGLGSFGSDEWVIIGAETGNRKGRIIPKREWVENIVEAAQITGMKVFMKESLRDLMGADFRQEFPWEVSANDA